MIPDNYKPIRQVGNGKTVSFSFDFPMLSENFIKVYREQDGVQELVDPSEYVWGYIPVEGEDAPVEDIAPENVITFYEAPADGVVIVIAREIPLEQTTPYKTSSGFPAVRVEDNFDKLTAITQQLTETLERCVKVEITDDQDPQELIDDVFEKLDTATEVGEQAIKTAQETQELVEGSKALIQEETQKAIEQLSSSSDEIINKARIWAEGEQSEVKPLGGELSSMGAADLAYAIANAPEDTPIDASGLFAMNVVKGEKGDKGDKGEDGKDGGGLEIGDIAFAALGIDESKNLRRYLNGQVISQNQFVSFTNWVKERAKLYPNTVATEENWQAEVTNSVLGQCGKFVVDDALGTIRLPKIIMPIQSLTDLSKLGEIVEAGLPNIEGTAGQVKVSTNNNTGALTYTSGTASKWNDSASGSILKLDASLSNPIYGNSNTVQQEAVQYPYFIQVATGTEETVDVTREIELNNPFSLLDYKWSEYELTNASWLLSNGSFHSGTVYKSVYELLLKIQNGTETKDGVSVKLSTEVYEDTDFVINTADTTFRLPIKVKLASGNAVAGNGMTLGLTNGSQDFGLSYSGNVDFGLWGSTSGYGADVGQTPNGNVQASKTVGITTDSTKSGIETSSSGLKLYFYVGETIQDANVINASGVLTRVAELSDSYISGLGMPDYTAGINITSLPYIAPADGLISILGEVSNSTIVLKLNDEPMLLADMAANATVARDIRVKKGDVLAALKASGTVPLNRADRGEYSMFYPLKGVN